VSYTTAGTAKLGIDYTLSGVAGQVTIPAGQSSVNLTLTALSDMTKEKAEKAKLILSPRSNYRVPKRTGKSATIRIINGH
jgi:hypothetical protein